MPTPRELRQQNLEKILNDARYELEFLNDSSIFYPMSSITSQRTVMLLDFNEAGGKKYINTDQTRMLSSEWYKNYVGFLPEESADFDVLWNKTRATIKMYRVYKYVTVSDTTPTPWNWIIRFDDSLTNTDGTFGRFVPYDVSLSTNGFDIKYTDSIYYFSTQAKAQQAIDLMLDVDYQDASTAYLRGENSLRYMFNMDLRQE